MTILDEIEEFLRERVILKSDAEYKAVTLWIGFANSVDEYDFSPRLAIFSPEKRCGKTLLLEVISHLILNSRMTSSISAAALYRTIERDPSLTILIDESDTAFGRNSDPQKGEALRTVMNGGFKRGNPIIKCEGNSFEPKDFHVFCPLAIAGIGIDSIPETVRDRSILIEMRRKMSNENIVEFDSDEIELSFYPLRDRLLSWIEINKGKFRIAKPQIPEKLNSRARDVWKPLLKIAEVAGEEWLLKASEAALAIASNSEEADDTPLSIRLLEDIREIFTEEKLPTKDLISRLRGLEESPWANMDKFNASLLAKMLRSYGIKSHHWNTYRGYVRNDFSDSWNRYLSPKNPVTPVTPVTLSKSEISDASDASDSIFGIYQKINQFNA